MRTHALVVLVLSVAACSPQPPPTGAVELRLVHHAGDFAANVPRTVTNDLDVAVTLTRGYFVVSAIELIDCASAVRPWWRRVEVISSAHAHGDEGPTKFASPTVDSLLRADGASKTLGTLEPPLGSYCRMSVTLGPADADARDLPSDVDLVGTTLHLEGTHRASGASTDTPFTLRTALTAVHRVELGEETATLSEEGERRTVTLGVDYAKWFDGIDFSTGDDASRARTLVENAKRSLHAEPAGGH